MTQTSPSGPDINWAPIRAFLAVLLPPIFVVLAKRGWITGLTPENAHLYVSALLDYLVVIGPLAVAAWAAWGTTRQNLIKTTNALPGVLGIAVTPALDDKIDAPTVTTPEKLQRVIILDRAQAGPQS